VLVGWVPVIGVASFHRKRNDNFLHLTSAPCVFNVPLHTSIYLQSPNYSLLLLLLSYNILSLSPFPTTTTTLPSFFSVFIFFSFFGGYHVSFFPIVIILLYFFFLFSLFSFLFAFTTNYFSSTTLNCLALFTYIFLTHFIQF